MKIESSKLLDAISLCGKVVDSEDVNIDCNGNFIIVSVASNFNKASVKFKTKCDTCSFSISKDLILGVLRGTKEIELLYSEKDKTLKFKGGAKKGSLSTSIYKPINVLPQDLSNKQFFDEDIKKTLVSLLSTVNIYPTAFLPESESSLDIQIESTGKELKLLCVDRYHSAFCSSKIKANKFKLNIPCTYISYFSLFDKSFEIATDSNCLYLYNNEIKLCVPQVVTNSVINLDSYASFVKTNLSNPILELSNFNVSAFSEALTATDTVKTNTTDIYIEVSKKGINLKCESERGKVYADVDYEGKLNKDYEAIIGQLNTLDIIRLLSKKCTLKLYSNFMLYEDKRNDVEYLFICAVGHKTTK